MTDTTELKVKILKALALAVTPQAQQELADAANLEGEERLCLARVLVEMVRDEQAEREFILGKFRYGASEKGMASLMGIDPDELGERGLAFAATDLDLAFDVPHIAPYRAPDMRRQLGRNVSEAMFTLMDYVASYSDDTLKALCHTVHNAILAERNFQGNQEREAA